MSLTVAIIDKDETIWDGNITHNMGVMASHIPVNYRNEDDTVAFMGSLYDIVWRADNIGDPFFLNTAPMVDVLSDGICYMIQHRLELLQYNPDNGWGSYDDFLNWLISYKNQCEDNPNCKIEISR